MMTLSLIAARVKPLLAGSGSQKAKRRAVLVDGSSTSGPGHHQDQFSAELFEMTSGPMAMRIRAELEFARLKKTSRGGRAEPGEQKKGIGGTLAVYGAGYLVACAIIAVGGVMTPWLGALIVGSGVLAAAAVLVLRQHRA
jgi:hypothetical protein